MMSVEYESLCELTNSFSITLTLTTESDFSGGDNLSMSSGLPVFHIPKQKIVV